MQELYQKSSEMQDKMMKAVLLGVKEDLDELRLKHETVIAKLDVVNKKIKESGNEIKQKLSDAGLGNVSHKMVDLQLDKVTTLSELEVIEKQIQTVHQALIKETAD